MLDKIKALLLSVEPKVAAVVGMAPLAAGIAIGYLGHEPISLALKAIGALIKLI